MIFPKIINEDHAVYQVIAEGIKYTASVGEGRPIPVVLLDCPARSALDDLLEIHAGLGGDAKMTWGKPITLRSNNVIRLKFEFSKPMDVVFSISFDLEHQYGLILGILESRGVYLQRGMPGDKASTAKGNTVMVEVPDMKFEPYFFSMMRKLIIRRNRNAGLSKAQAIAYYQDEIRDRQAMYRMRVTAEQTAETLK